jgi:hypothetical protein
VHYETERNKVTAVTAKRELLDRFMVITGMTLIRLFDISRIPKTFHSYDGQKDQILVRYPNEKIFGNGIAFDESYASYFRGFQLIDNKESREVILESIVNKNDSKNVQYEKFIAYDLKNTLYNEVLCDPSKLSNYFIASELPHELSVAFFKLEILDKYHRDTDKYIMDKRSIRCVGGWYLKSYDINDEEEVHVYLIDLGALPHKEQLYWKSYNISSKNKISKQAFVTDFKGEPYDSDDPLDLLKLEIRSMCTEELNWYKLKEVDLIDTLHYLTTSNRKQWKDQVHNLHKIVIEGLQEKEIKKLIQNEGQDLAEKKSMQSLKIYLVEQKVEEKIIDQIINPLQEINKIRQLNSHSKPTEETKLVSQVLIDYQTLKNHFKYLIKSSYFLIKELRKVMPNST